MSGVRAGSRLCSLKLWSRFEASKSRTMNSEISGCNLVDRSWLHSVVLSGAGESEMDISAASSPTESSSSEVQKLHNELMETMKGRRIPQSTMIFSLLQQCSNPADMKLALEAIARLRTTRAIQGQQHTNFSDKLSRLVVESCLRVKDPESALKTIWAHNIYGFTPTLEAAHQILAYARDQHDSTLMRKTLKTMVLNSLSPTGTTADIVLRLCKEQGNEALLHSLAKNFHENGLKLRPALYDVCISTAANAGEAKHVFEIQQWRSKFKLPLTTASTFALSKANLLKRKPKDAAQLIHTHVQESEERNMYLRVLVRAWPAEVLSRQKRSINETNLKTDVEAMLKELGNLGCHLGNDLAQEFGKGKETLRKVVYS